MTLGLGGAGFAQSTLTLSSVTAAPGNTVSLSLSLSSPVGREPAALQWALNYPAASVANLTVAPGPSMIAAGETLSCNGGPASYICVAYALKAATLANGVVATVQVTLTAGATTTSIGVVNAMGAGADGSALAASPRRPLPSCPSPRSLAARLRSRLADPPPAS
jgi:hypothetical protein